MNWTAVGAIATAVAVIVALIANYLTNRNNAENRKLQVDLLRQQRAQKKLDEMVQNVMQLSKSMNALDIVYYSMKFKDDTFTVEDRRALEHLTVEGSCNAVNLIWQMEMLKNHDSAQPMLDCFWDVWGDYGCWSSYISALFRCMCVPKETQLEREEARSLTEMLIEDMVNKTLTMDANYKSVLDDLLKNKKELIARAQAVMGEFGMAIAGRIQQKSDVLYDKMKEFIRIEQERIEAIVK